jgi:hypothetical protein
MNKHIELVKKWLADNDSVSQEQLKDNCAAADAAAYDVYVAANSTNSANAAYAAADAAYEAYDAANSAAAAANTAKAAAYCVKRYEEIKEQE